MLVSRNGRLATCLATALLLAACGSDDPPAPTSFRVGGTVSGLGASGKLTLLNNGASPLVVSANGNFELAAATPAKGSYALTVGTDPLGQTCTLGNASGSGVQADIANVAVSCAASTSVVVHAFTGSTDGRNGRSSLTLGNDGKFYGVATAGGDPVANAGTLFRVSGSAGAWVYEVVHTFDTLTAGADPDSRLLLAADGSFYGTTQSGGNTSQFTDGAGVIFKLTPSGNTFTYSVVYALNGTTDGAFPTGNLIQGADGSFYGVTGAGGDAGTSAGTVYKLTPSGAGFTYTVLYAFLANGDGGDPMGVTQGSDGNLYGGTFFGGDPATNAGTLFKLAPSGTNWVFSVLHTFNGSTDGSSPASALVQGRDGRLYGSALKGYADGSVSTLFAITPSASTDDFTVLHTLNGTTDGDQASGALVQGPDGSFYGTASFAGDATALAGTLFKLTVTGNAATYTVLHALDGVNDGSNPGTGLLLAPDGHFYGVAPWGGSGNLGTVFRF
jgi:uncharacterized repeat protein (TIGR03803 family)